MLGRTGGLLEHVEAFIGFLQERESVLLLQAIIDYDLGKYYQAKMRRWRER